ncbi:MAG TPA: hypothetical protein VGM56_03775 [Byssovorax sp.]
MRSSSTSTLALDPSVAEGLGRGRWDAPAWAIAALGGGVSLAAVAWLVLRVVRARRKRRVDAVPISRRRGAR